jgi:cytochrome c
MRLLLAMALVATLILPAQAVEGDPRRGRQAYRACAACHSLAPDRNMTGPTLAGLWGRKAGSLPSFQRYSPALKSVDFLWDEDTLDPWLKDPARTLPGNRMMFRGIDDAQVRADLIAYLKQASAGGEAAEASPPMGGGMMGGRSAPNLRRLSPAQQVQAITYCGDTYRVTTVDGEVHEFWERNLRFKTDSSNDGPEKGAVAIVRAGMMGDRASVIFATPEEISARIKPAC